MATSTTMFEQEIKNVVPLSDRGLMAGAAYRLRQYYESGQPDPLAHTLAKNNPRQVEALTRCGFLASFDAILGA